MTKWVACLLYKGYQVILFIDEIEKRLYIRKAELELLGSLRAFPGRRKQKQPF